MSEIIVPGGWRDRIEELAGRRRQAWPVVAIAAVAVVAGLWLWIRGAPPAIAPPARDPRPAAVAGEADATARPAPATEPTVLGEGEPNGGREVILVHVAGAVRRPGLYELRTGARVAEAIDAARGPRAGADLNAINLAESLVDGAKLDVPRFGESPVPVPSVSGASGSYGTGTDGAAPAVIPLNTADQAALETIPGVGPVTATAILEYRTQIGAFESIDQLLEVSGIGPATLESIRPYVSI
ncbi:MAG: helix-hairpin-helix domain-containing protein [Actinomycetota bacterium]|nr:helix-hairpin-helix domain-containing protein [Actinomycetota bacterium]